MNNQQIHHGGGLQNNCKWTFVYGSAYSARSSESFDIQQLYAKDESKLKINIVQ